jgi:hypothetical protein
MPDDGLMRVAKVVRTGAVEVALIAAAEVEMIGRTEELEMATSATEDTAAEVEIGAIVLNSPVIGTAVGVALVVAFDAGTLLVTGVLPPEPPHVATAPPGAV